MQTLSEFDIFSLWIFFSVVAAYVAWVLANHVADRIYRNGRMKSGLAKIVQDKVEESEEFGRIPLVYTFFPVMIISLLIGGFLENHLVSIFVLIALTAACKLRLDRRKCWKCGICGVKAYYIGSNDGLDFFRCKNGHVKKYRKLKHHTYFSIGGFGAGGSRGGSGGFGGGSTGGGGAGR